MSWSRRAVLSGLAATPWLGCTGAGTERRPPQTPSSVDVRLPTITHGSLSSGPELYLVEDHGLPLVALGVAVAAGHRHEQPGEEGRAAVAAAMVTEGMEGGDRATLLDRYGELGTTPHASVGPSQLVLGCTVHRDDAPAALRLMLDNLRSPTGADEAFERVVRAQRESLQAARGDPESVAGLGLLLASQGVEPPAITLAEGTTQSLATLTPETARTWLRPRLRLDGLVFLVAGDVREAEVLRWIGDVIAGWPPAPGPRPADPPAPEVIPEGSRPRTVLVRWPQLSQAIVALGGPREPYGHADEPAQTLAEGIMASLMHYELRRRRRISYGVQRRPWTTKLGAASQLWAKVEPAGLGEATQQLWGYLERFQREGQLAEEALADDRRVAMIGMMHDYHGAEPGLGQLRRLAEGGLPAVTAQRRLDRLQGLDAAAVTVALRRMYHPDRVSVCVVGDGAVLDQARAVLPADGVIERTPAQLFGLSDDAA